MSKNILIIDDEPANIFTLKFMLENNGYITASCDCGRKALDMLSRESFDIILLDVMLPDIDGYEVCQEIRKIDRDVPIIMVTALTINDNLKKGLESGANDYVKKPIDEIELIARIKNALITNEAIQETKRLYSALLDDLETASRIQSYMLPKMFQITDNIMLSSEYTPSDKIGGDMFDVIKLPDSRYFVYIGDISGHGIQAALLMSAVKSKINMIVEHANNMTSPAEFMNRLNSVLSVDLLKDSYLTMIAGFINLDKGTLRYFNAGHPPIIQYDPKKQEAFTCECTGGGPIGWTPDREYLPEQEGVVDISSGNIVLLYTDGITECEDINSELLGIAGLCKLMEQSTGSTTCLPIPSRIKRFLTADNYNISADDFSMLAFQCIAKTKNRIYFDINQKSGISNRKDQLANVCQICSLCEKKIFEWTGSTELASKTDIVISELLNNIIIHGINNKNGSAVGELSFDGNIQIRLWDDGIAWQADRSNSSPQELPGNIGNLPEQGRGLDIINNIAADFSCKRKGKINETTICFPGTTASVKYGETNA